MLLRVFRNLHLFLDNEKHRQKRTLRLRNSLEFEKLVKNRLWCSVLVPNITGVANGLVNAKDAGTQAAITSFYTGCFSTSTFASQLNSNIHAGDNDHQVVLKMNASNGSSVFGSVTTVQPNAAQILIIIKVWNAAGWTVADLE